MRSQSAVGFVRHCSKLIGVYSEAKTVPVPCTLENFSLQYLRNDGILILRILAANTNDVIVAELVEEMWNRLEGGGVAIVDCDVIVYVLKHVPLSL